jgi:hypothetical protein
VQELLDRVLRDVPRTRDETRLAFERFVASLQHLLGEVDGAVAGGLRPDQRTTPREALAGQHAGELVTDLPVLPEQVADLAPAHADVAGRHVRELPDVPLQLGHERLTEPHHLAVALAFRIEVRPALGASHRQRGQRVLEHLLEREELQEAQVHRGMEPKSSLVRPDRAVHLDAIAAVDLDLAGVVHPRDAEHDHALGLDHPLEDLRLAVLGIPFEGDLNRLGHLAHRLVELELARVPGDDVVHQLVHVSVHRRLPSHP